MQHCHIAGEPNRNTLKALARLSFFVHIDIARKTPID